MTDKPQDESSPDDSSQDPSERPPLADQIRAKIDEYEVDRRLTELADTVSSAVRLGMTKAGEFAHEHRGDIERMIDKAASAVDRRTEGKHAEKIQQVRGSLERGVEKIAEQRHDATPDEPGGPEGPDEPAGPGDDVPPSNG